MPLADDIAELEAILQEGAEQVAVDGTSVRYRFDEIRRRLAALKRQQEPTKRPRIAQIDLSDC